MSEPKSNLRTCLGCGWVHFGVTRQHAEDEVSRFNAYVQEIDSIVWQQLWGGTLSDIKDYESCFRCGGSFKNFRNSVDGDCPEGCTLQPIINDEVTT